MYLESKKQVWWPTHIPFESITTAPADFEGMFRVMISNSSKISVYFLCCRKLEWSDGLREILASCYRHHGLNPETYIFKDPEDDSRETSFLPEELRPRPPPPNLPASRLLPDPQGKRLRSDGDELEDDDRRELEDVKSDKVLLVDNLILENSCRRFDWMLQSSSRRDEARVAGTLLL